MFAAADASANGFRFLSIIEPSSSPPDRRARDLNVWGLVKLGPAMRAAAWVAEGSHLVSVVAPVMNTTIFLAGIPLSSRFFDDLRPAARWLSEHGPSDADPIAAHVAELRQLLTERGIV